MKRIILTVLAVFCLAVVWHSVPTIQTGGGSAFASSFGVIPATSSTPSGDDLLNAILHKDTVKSSIVSIKYIGDPLQVAVDNDWGVITPTSGTDFALTSSGEVYNPQEWMDKDFPPYGWKGDSAAIMLEVNVPAGATTLRFEFEMLSYEYPEYVGSMFNDYFSATLITPDGQKKELAFDMFNNPMNINNAFFDPALDLTGTGFDLITMNGQPDAGRTGRLVTVASIQEYIGKKITLKFEVGDVGDGIYTTTALLDNLYIGPGVSPQIPVTLPVEPEKLLQAYIDIMPRAINVESKGKFVMCRIEVPAEGVVGTNFDLGSIRISKIDGKDLANKIPSVGKAVAKETDDGADVMCRFDRATVANALKPAYTAKGPQSVAEVEVSGKLKNGTSFTGKTGVKVIYNKDMDMLNKKKPLKTQ